MILQEILSGRHRPPHLGSCKSGEYLFIPSISFSNSSLRYNLDPFGYANNEVPNHAKGLRIFWHSNGRWDGHRERLRISFSGKHQFKHDDRPTSQMGDHGCIRPLFHAILSNDFRPFSAWTIRTWKTSRKSFKQTDFCIEITSLVMTSNHINTIDNLIFKKDNHEGEFIYTSEGHRQHVTIDGGFVRDGEGLIK